MVVGRWDWRTESVACAVVVMSLTLVGCGDEKDSGESGPTTSSSAAAGTGGSAGAGGGGGGSGPESIAVVTDCEVPAVVLQAEVNLAENQAYGPDPAQTLDIAWPKTPGATPFPLVVVIHQGGWSGGDKLDERDHILQLAGAGYAAVSINHRLAEKNATTNRFPAAVEDARCAVRWLRSKVGAYGIDPSRLGVIGGSTGGHLASMLGVASEVPGLDGTCMLDEPVTVSAVVAYYAIHDLRDEDGESGVENFLGAAPSAVPDMAALGSPITHVDATDPPFFLVHGTEDTTIAPAESADMQAALWKANVPATLVTIEGAGHGFDLLGESDEGHDLRPATCTTLAFLEATLIAKP